MPQIVYYPEMNEVKPEADGSASLSHYGRHYYLKTYVELKGRGIKFLSTLNSEDLPLELQHRVGLHEYKVTCLAYEKLCKIYTFSNAIML